MTKMRTYFSVRFSTLIDGRRATGSFEMDDDRATRNIIVRDILEGQYEGVDRVFMFCPEEHTCEDITGDIAMDVAGQLFSQGSTCPEHLRDWLSEHYEIYAPQRIDFAASGEAA